MPQIAGIKYPERICSSNFVVEDFSGLVAHPSIFLIKDSTSG